ncbi:MAG: DUF4258 domain-containing protein [Parcubacteria group bacterium]|nr:DUF4258 domain-containing protein [Parcubacteria group bacterium]
MPKIIFSDHAIYQMRERKITEKLVKLALNKPDKIILQFNFRKKSIKQFKRRRRNYLLIVVYEEQRAAQKVITAFITSKIQKYLTD